MQHRNLRPPSPLKYSDVFYGWPLILLPSVCILTFCIVFQSESSSSVTYTRLKMKKEMVACRCLARRQGITTIWISQHGWCVWIPIKNTQGIIPEIKILWYKDNSSGRKKCQKQKFLTSNSCHHQVHQNVQNWIESIVQLTVEYSRYSLFHFDMVEDIQVV